jgi:cytoskeletal protein CcmA (bactofilin family)
MFQKDNSNHSSLDTIIGSAIQVEGNFEGQGNIIIEGVVKGNLKTSQNITAGESSRIIADLEATSANIAGEIHGNLRISDKLEIESTAVIKGNIEAGVISVASGASIDGYCKIGNIVHVQKNEAKFAEEDDEDND